jgi:hypothetical protein
MAISQDQIQELVGNALHEKWAFIKCEHIESIERHYKPCKSQFLTSTINEMLRKARNSNSVIKIRPNFNLPKPIEKIEIKPFLYWLISISDPISSIIAESNDSYNISVNTMLIQKISELATKINRIEDSVIMEKSGGVFKKKRPSDITSSITALKLPNCDIRGECRWAVVAVCEALNVGVVVKTGECIDVICWNPRMALFDEAGSFTQSSDKEVRDLLIQTYSELILQPSPSIITLKEACRCIRLQKPLPRSRAGLVKGISDWIQIYTNNDFRET